MVRLAASSCGNGCLSRGVLVVRTPEPRREEQAADLSYWQIVVPRGLEPRTLRLLAVRSNQLSYETSVLFLSLVADSGWVWVSVSHTKIYKVYIG